MKRREFLAATGGVALSALSYRRVLGANDRMGMALIGSGRRGRDVMKAFLATGRVELRCIADIYDVQRQRARDMLGVKPEETAVHEEALSRTDVDAVLIGSPDHLHLPLTLAALAAGKHVFMEKPTTHNLDEGAQLIAAVKQSGKVCQTGTQQRSGAHYKRAKAEYLDTGKLGKVIFVRASWSDFPWQRRKIAPQPQPAGFDWNRFIGPAKKVPYDWIRYDSWRYFPDYGGGLLADILTHWADVAQWFLNETKPQSAVASGGIYQLHDGRENPDTVSAILQYRPGGTCTSSPPSSPSRPTAPRSCSRAPRDRSTSRATATSTGPTRASRSRWPPRRTWKSPTPPSSWMPSRRGGSRAPTSRPACRRAIPFTWPRRPIGRRSGCASTPRAFALKKTSSRSRQGLFARPPAGQLLRTAGQAACGHGGNFMSMFRRRPIASMLMWVPFLFVLAAAFPAVAHAQNTSASLSGTIIDPTGGVLPGVQVTCKNVRTGVSQETVSNAVGIFRFSDLPIGQSEVTLSLMGFQTLKRPDIALITGQQLDLKLTMQAGGLETTVNVTESIPITQTTSSTVQTSMTVRQVQELPLNGRNPLQLVVLTAGAAVTDAGTVTGQQDNRGVTVNGLRATQNNWRLDGSNYNNRFFGSAPVLPNPDTLEEFTVQSANYSARTAGAGALVELATRSGGNQFHASAFEFLRDTSLNANDFFNNKANREKPPFKLNQYGGTGGGAIIQNKTFFFGAYQGTKRRSSPGVNSIRSLTEAERNGNFSDYSGKIIDPATGQAFAGNIVPSNKLDPMVKQILTDMLPLPNSGLNLVFPNSQDLDDDQVTTRIDHQFSSRNRLTFRYFYDANRFQRPFAAPPGFYAKNDFRNQSLLFRDSHIFSSTFMLTMSGSYSKFRRVQEPIAPGMKTLQAYGVNAPQSVTTDFFPGVRFFAAPLFQLFSGGGLEQTPSTYDFHVTGVWSKGRHNLQAGADITVDKLYVLDASFTVGSWTYNGSRTGYLPADIMMGLPSAFVQDSGRTINLTEKKYHFWVQDDWKVGPKLTINAGVRWEPWTPSTDSLNNLVGFVKGQQSTMAPDAPLGMVYPGDSGISESLFPNDYSAFAPRVGFAYDLKGDAKWVVRGGYGIFYIDPPTTLYTRTVSTQPSVLTVNITNPYNFQNPYTGFPGGNPYPFPRVQPENFATFKYVKPVSGGVLDPASTKGYSQNWNVTLEHQMLNNLVLSFAYVGNKGSNILGAMELNPAVYGPGATTGNTNARRIYAGMSAMEIASPFQRSRYDSFQFTATKRSSNGLTILGTYVYSVNKDNSSSTIEGGGSYPRSTWDPDIDYSYSDFDVRHRMNMSIVYDLPWKASGATGAFVNDWQANMILVARSGLPFSVLSGTDRSLSAIGRDNADQVGDITPAAGSESCSGSTRRRSRPPRWAHLATRPATASAARARSRWTSRSPRTSRSGRRRSSSSGSSRSTCSTGPTSTTRTRPTRPARTSGRSPAPATRASSSSG